MSYVRTAILYESEAWCLKESEMGILGRMKRPLVRVMCGVQLEDGNRAIELMFGLNETMDQLSMTNSVCWYGHVLRRENGHVLRRTLDIEVEAQRRKGRLKRAWRKQVEEESVKVDLKGKMHFANQSGVLALLRLLLG